MTTTHIALLRGINVGGKNKLPMKDLAVMFTEAGCTDVRTYIQSGNVVFAADAELAGLPRIGMDQITLEAERNREARLVEAAQARELVDDALLRLHDRFAERVYGPLFGALQQRYRHTAQEGVKRLLKKELSGLGDNERAAIETWSEVLARRFAHIPCLGLRGFLYNGPDGSLDAFLDGLDPEFADELRQALDQAATPKRATGR